MLKVELAFILYMDILVQSVACTYMAVKLCLDQEMLRYECGMLKLGNVFMYWWAMLQLSDVFNTMEDLLLVEHTTTWLRSISNEIVIVLEIYSPVN